MDGMDDDGSDGTTIAIVVDEVDIGDDPDGRKSRREILNRRPSYRKIFENLAQDPPSMMEKIEEEGNTNSSSDNQGSQEATTNSSQATLYQSGNTVVIPASIQIATHNDGSGQGLQTLTMSNSSGATGTTIVQYTQGPDGSQYFIPASGVQAYQLTSGASLGQSVVVASAGSLGGGGQVTEEVSRKRELRLLKNREAARECRRKKKDYIKCLENRVAVLENQNKTLMDELKSLKELYCNSKD